MQRRTLVKLGAASGAALVLAGGGTALVYRAAWRDGRLTTAGRGVLAAVARAVLDGSLPAEAAAQHAVMAAHLDRMDATLRAMPPATQRDVADLLALLSLAAGRIALAGLYTDWAQADIAQVQGALQAMRSSRLALRRQAYHALRDLTHAAFFSDRASWTLLRYPGPPALA